MAETKSKEANEPKAEKAVAQKAAPSGPMVTNHYTSAISIPGTGVTIPASAKGQDPVAVEVPGFDPKHGVIKQWLDKKVITVK